MRILRDAALLASSLLFIQSPVSGFPLDAFLSTDTPHSTPKLTLEDLFTAPSIVQRDTPEPLCDLTCTYRILFQAAYSAASAGIEYGMATHKAQDFCFKEGEQWCPQLVDSSTTMIASKSSYMEIENYVCDESCMLVALAEVSRRGGL